MGVLRITQIRSAVSRTKDQGRTLRALGLRRIGSSVLHEDRPEILGMIKKVSHLIEVERGAPSTGGRPERESQP